MNISRQIERADFECRRISSVSSRPGVCIRMNSIARQFIWLVVVESRLRHVSFPNLQFLMAGMNEPLQRIRPTAAEAEDQAFHYPAIPTDRGVGVA